MIERKEVVILDFRIIDFRIIDSQRRFNKIMKIDYLNDFQYYFVYVQELQDSCIFSI